NFTVPVVIAISFSNRHKYSTSATGQRHLAIDVERRKSLVAPSAKNKVRQPRSIYCFYTIIVLNARLAPCNRGQWKVTFTQASIVSMLAPVASRNARRDAITSLQKRHDASSGIWTFAPSQKVSAAAFDSFFVGSPCDLRTA